MPIRRYSILLTLFLLVIGTARAQECSTETGCETRFDGVIEAGDTGVHQRERKRISNIEVHFKFDNYDIDLQYMGNGASLHKFSRTIDSIGLSRIDSVVVVSKSSPEGVYEHNVMLAKRRAKTMHNYLLEHHPELSDRLYVRGDTESWPELRDYVVRDTLMKQSTIERVLAVIDADVNRGTKKWRMEQLPIYRYLRATYYPLLRNSSFFILYYEDKAVVFEPVEGVDVEHDTPALDNEPKVEPKSFALKPSSVAAAPQGVDTEMWSRKLHVKSNALGWGFAITNAAVEVDIVKHLSVSVPLYYSAYNYFTETIKFRTLAVQPELRYWFKENNQKFFVGAHFGYAQYNLAVDGDYRYQDHGGNTPLLGGGLSVGYRMPIAKNNKWHVEFTVGAGVYRLHYDKFYNTPDTKDGMFVESVKRTYWGIDNVAVSFSYSFDLKKKGGKR